MGEPGYGTSGDGVQQRSAVRRSWSEGFRVALALAAGYFPAAVAFGVVAGRAGLSVPEAGLVSGVVFAGASQFALVGLLAAGSALPVAALTAIVVNLRHLLYGPSLAPYLRNFGAGRAAVGSLGLTDEVFAVASESLPRRSATLGWLMVIEAGAYGSWMLGTLAGASGGAAITNAVPSLGPALGFALPALFVALLVSSLSSGGGARPHKAATAATAAAVIAAAFHLAGLTNPGILVAGVAGPAVGLLAGNLRERWPD